MNKRPLPCVLAGFVLGEVWMWQFHGTAALAALCLAAIIFIIIGVMKKGSFFVLLGIGLMLGGYQTQEWNLSKEQMNLWMNGQTHLIQGRIEEMEEKEYSYSIVMNQVSIDNVSQEGRILVYLAEKPNGYIGSTILLKGRLEPFDSSVNPGGFDLKAYREGKGILGLVPDAEILQVWMGSFLIKDLLYGIREKSTLYLKKHMKEEYTAIGIAMTFGEKDDLSDEQKILYQFGGISHVLAVSGLHMSLLGAALYKLFRKIGAGYWISVCFSLPCIVCYTVMTGMSTSCSRAAFMLIIYLIGEVKGYYYDLPSAFSLAAIWLLFEVPARLFDSGFLLSFGAVISVGIIWPFLCRLFQYKTGDSKIRDGLLSGIIITVFTLPFSLFFFYGFSLAGLLLNLIVIPLMSFLVPLLFVGGMGWTSLIPDYFAGLCLKLAEWILWFYDLLCRFTVKLPFSYIGAGYRGIIFLIWYYILLILLLGMLYAVYQKKKKLFFPLFPVALICVSMFVSLTGRKDAFLTMLDVGQGDGILYHSESGEVCMFDGGSTSERNVGKYVLEPALQYYGIDKVDYWFVSHFDDDHISGLKELLESGQNISYLILPVRKEESEKQLELEMLARKNQTKIYYMKQGEQIKLKTSTFYCIYPKKNNKGNENENSMVLLLDTSYQQILFTGDVEKEGELNMVKQLSKYSLDDSKEQILKVSHHGSANGSQMELLQVFKPDTALISCGENNRYGHPSKETVERIRNAGAGIYETMKYGAIEIRLGKETSYLGYGVVN